MSDEGDDDLIEIYCYVCQTPGHEDFSCPTLRCKMCDSENHIQLFCPRPLKRNAEDQTFISDAISLQCTNVPTKKEFGNFIDTLKFDRPKNDKYIKEVQWIDTSEILIIFYNVNVSLSFYEALKRRKPTWLYSLRFVKSPSKILCLYEGKKILSAVLTFKYAESDKRAFTENKLKMCDSRNEYDLFVLLFNSMEDLDIFYSWMKEEKLYEDFIKIVDRVGFLDHAKTGVQERNGMEQAVCSYLKFQNLMEKDGFSQFVNSGQVFSNCKEELTYYGYNFNEKTSKFYQEINCSYLSANIDVLPEGDAINVLISDLESFMSSSRLKNFFVLVHSNFLSLPLFLQALSNTQKLSNFQDLCLGVVDLASVAPLDNKSLLQKGARIVLVPSLDTIFRNLSLPARDIHDPVVFNCCQDERMPSKSYAKSSKCYSDSEKFLFHVGLAYKLMLFYRDLAKSPKQEYDPFSTQHISFQDFSWITPNLAQDVYNVFLISIKRDATYGNITQICLLSIDEKEERSFVYHYLSKGVVDKKDLTPIDNDLSSLRHQLSQYSKIVLVGYNIGTLLQMLIPQIDFNEEELEECFQMNQISLAALQKSKKCVSFNYENLVKSFTIDFYDFFMKYGCKVVLDNPDVLKLSDENVSAYVDIKFHESYNNCPKNLSRSELISSGYSLDEDSGSWKLQNCRVLELPKAISMVVSSCVNQRSWLTIITANIKIRQCFIDLLKYYDPSGFERIQKYMIYGCEELSNFIASVESLSLSDKFIKSVKGVGDISFYLRNERHLENVSTLEELHHFYLQNVDACISSEPNHFSTAPPGNITKYVSVLAKHLVDENYYALTHTFNSDYFNKMLLESNLVEFREGICDIVVAKSQLIPAKSKMRVEARLKGFLFTNGVDERMIVTSPALKFPIRTEESDESLKRQISTDLNKVSSISDVENTTQSCFTDSTTSYEEKEESAPPKKIRCDPEPNIVDQEIEINVEPVPIRKVDSSEMLGKNCKALTLCVLNRRTNLFYSHCLDFGAIKKKSFDYELGDSLIFRLMSVGLGVENISNLSNKGTIVHDPRSPPPLIIEQNTLELLSSKQKK
ncbi:unnamed protein product [Lepeophtheirus salmonis]|uniref:(salmon louse) hypothetical protein n=1 Tax=Lepeophtheirus salmonis TaxID=72036 RepID=A0A7R8CQU8_LEPSM|nr:unnamed protein product [Lepeophtheirus salmonis]CAF2898626.1 unnamed protein product [Lepeophtheirus salmonis]